MLSRNGHTVIHEAAAFGNTAVLEYLLDHHNLYRCILEMSVRLIRYILCAYSVIGALDS